MASLQRPIGMPPPKLECPECGAVLKPSKPVPPGKKVKCPKCGEIFAAPDGDEAPKVRKRPAAKPAARASSVQAKAPAPPPKKAHDEEEVGIYGFVKEPEKARDEDDEDDDDKPDLTFALDESIRDPRGPAQVKVVRPSNFLMIAGVIEVLIGIAILGVNGWPLIFSQEWVDPHVVATGKKAAKPDDAPPPLERKELKPEQLAELEELEQQFLITSLIWMGASIPYIVIGSLIVVGGVKMQQLESYGWAMTACILAIVFGTILGLLFGIMALMTLLDPVVKKGFEYEREHRKDTV
jgi:predicted Zn finger-like uncharacterized protein